MDMLVVFARPLSIKHTNPKPYTQACSCNAKHTHTHLITYFIEMPTSLSLGPCRAKTHQPKTQYPNMFMTYQKTHTSLKRNTLSRLAPCRAQTYQPKIQHPNMFMTHKQNTHPIEMCKSLSLGPFGAILQLQTTTVSSDMEFTHLIEMHTSRSLGPCRARTR